MTRGIRSIDQLLSEHPHDDRRCATFISASESSQGGRSAEISAGRGTVTWPRDLPRPEHEFTAEAASPEAALAQSLAPANAECPPLLRPDLAPGPVRFPGSFLCCTHVLDVRLFGVARVNGLPFEHAFDTVKPSLEIRSQDRYLGHDFFLRNSWSVPSIALYCRPARPLRTTDSWRTAPSDSSGNIRPPDDGRPGQLRHRTRRSRLELSIRLTSRGMIVLALLARGRSLHEGSTVNGHVGDAQYRFL